MSVIHADMKHMHGNCINSVRVAGRPMRGFARWLRCYVCDSYVLRQFHAVLSAEVVTT
jgi:hypothetical protein